MSDNNTTVQPGCGGCITSILLIIAVWALLFGVTVNGQHYGLDDCSFERGVEIK